VKINSRTKLCILIGDPVEHSVSPEIHNSAFQALGLNYVYLAFPVKRLKEALQGIRGLGIRGASVTIPHKESIIPYLDELDELAKKIGAVNTVLNDNGKLIGYNTDGESAYLSLIKNGARLEGKKVVVLGAGGASRSITFTLAVKGKAQEIVILDVIEERSEKLAKELVEKTGAKVRSELRENLKQELEQAKILVNASPVGMFPKLKDSPVPKEYLHKGLIVFDIVYNPFQTLLLKFAKEKGAKTIAGIEMLVRQAGEQFRLWTNKKPPLKVMFQVGRRAILGR